MGSAGSTRARGKTEGREQTEGTAAADETPACDLRDEVVCHKMIVTGDVRNEDKAALGARISEHSRSEWESNPDGDNFVLVQRVVDGRKVRLGVNCLFTRPSLFHFKHLENTWR